MSEKMPEASPLLVVKDQRRSAPSRRRFTVVAFLGLLAAGCMLFNIHWTLRYGNELLEDGPDEDKQWSWHDMKSHRTLKWQKCYDGKFECARLDVPMDWQEPSDDKRVVLGVMKLPAKTRGVSVPPIFINPGGPGGSGIAILQNLGPSIQRIAGDYHDIISWDPRGVGVSTPRMDCWGSFQKRLLWSMQDIPVVDQHPGLVYDAYSRATAFAGTCEIAMNETGIMHHLSTAYTARDMLEINEQEGHSKIRYWGFSYGTVLAGVFASMYPDKIERLVSDGNVGYKSWFEQDRAQFVKDTDSIFDTFDEACHKVGAEKCALWATSTEAVTERRARLLDKLKEKPVLVPAWATATGPEMPVRITYGVLQSFTRGLIYKPLANAPLMARVYAALEDGDGMPFYEAVTAGVDHVGEPMSKLLCSATDIPATEPQETKSEADAFPAIMCSDGVPVEDTPDDLAEYVEKLHSISKWAGVSNLLFRLPCIGWKARPKWRFVPDADVEIETENPILFVNNLYDNVTPLESAHNNSAHFAGSVVLQQNSLGHCSFAAPSTCTAKHIRAYFGEATLPKAGTKCDQDYDLFEMPGEDVVMALDDFSSAVWELSEKAETGFGGMQQW